MAIKKGVKIGIIVLVILTLAAGILFGLRFIFSQAADENTVYKVKTERYENIIEISGTVAAAQEQTLQALSDGTVVGLYVKAGDKVKKGDIILLLDDTTQQYNLAKHDYDMATTRITGSARELKLMETQRLALVQKIEDRKVVATFDGIIADLDVAFGESLEAKDSVGTLVNVDYLTAEVEVAETDVSKLQVGQKVELEFSAYDEETVYGYVESWPTIGEITSRGATIVNVKIRIDEFPSVILPNFSFTGKIQLEEPVDNLVVSRYAIGYEDKKPFVVLAKTGEKIFVKVQPYGKEYVKILEGLEGNEVLTQQSTPPKSGQNKNNKKNKNEGNPAMGGGMGGFGGPPPGM
ncbi:MAG: efflux RND transporter periplasmic adaptor subunit [Treponema sp.]|nr:efflux RND transporter periplasmic adaptor subunit [Treponema sp.]